MNFISVTEINAKSSINMCEQHTLLKVVQIVFGLSFHSKIFSPYPVTCLFMPCKRECAV